MNLVSDGPRDGVKAVANAKEELFRRRAKRARRLTISACCSVSLVLLFGILPNVLARGLGLACLILAIAAVVAAFVLAAAGSVCYLMIREAAMAVLSLLITVPALLLILLWLWFSGVSIPAAPAMNRMASAILFDEHQMYDVFVPSVEDQDDRSALAASLRQLEDHIAEFQWFMARVETGKVQVRANMKGGWFSFVEHGDSSIVAAYHGRLGPVFHFQKHWKQNQHSMAYEFMFYPNGLLQSAHTMEEGEGWFRFDEQGKVQHFGYETAAGKGDVDVREDEKIN